MSGSWDAMIRHNELQRRRELSKLSKVELIDTVMGFEQRAAERAERPTAAVPATSSQAGLASIRKYVCPCDVCSPEGGDGA